jgi:hypothetical protein
VSAEFFLKCFTVIGTIGAVAFALFGDRLRAWLTPVRIRIEPLREDEKNSTYDKEQGRRAYCHHLAVRNLTPHKPLENCRVWLKSVAVKQFVEKPPDEPVFAVPAPMEWAPSEYSRQTRTFCNRQFFDLGKAWDKEGAFEITIERDCGAAMNKLGIYTPRDRPDSGSVRHCGQLSCRGGVCFRG